jgi:hypothetical protein
LEKHPASIKDLYSGYIMEPDTNISQQDFNNLKNSSVVTGDDYFKIDTAC